MDAKTKLVLGHASILALRSCTFKVSQKGRERVIREQRKNVHAWIIGHYDEWCTDDDETMGVFVEYNPYKHEMFQRVWDEKPIQWSDYVLINGRNILAGY